MSKCQYCGLETNNPKFCSRSCAAKRNNLGVRRHGKPKSKCLICNKETKSYSRKYCSNVCSGKGRLKSEEHRKAMAAARQAKYRAKGLRKLDPSADKDKVNEFYRNRPEGYEVDHILPLAQGGLHHEDNLQYLTIEENRRKNKRKL